MTRVLMRLDADKTVGRGHLARCLPLARALIELGATVSIAIKPANPFRHELDTLKAEVILDPTWSVDRLEEAATDHDVVVLDVHDIPVATIHRVRRHASVAGLSAVGPGISQLDLLINPVAEEVLHQLPDRLTRRPRVRGGSYAVIVDHARFAHTQGIEPNPGTVLVTLGGGGGHTAALQAIIDRLASHGEVSEVTVCTTDPVHAPDPRVHVFSHPRDFPTRLASAAVVVCGLGSTLHEAASLGIPAVVVPQSPTHRQQAAWLQKHGFFILAQHSGEVDEACERILTEAHLALSMAAAGRSFARPETVISIAEEILRLHPRHPLDLA